MLEFAREEWMSCPEAHAMLPLVSSEVREGFELSQLHIDEKFFATLAMQGQLMLITARHDGWLVGMYLGSIGSHPLFAETRCAHHITIYLLAAYRGRQLGYADRLLDYAEHTMHEAGVQIMYVSRTATSHADRLYRRHGFALHEMTYMKVLEG